MSVDKSDYFLKVTDFIGLFNFEWYSQNKVGNVGILVLWRDRETSIHLVLFSGMDGVVSVDRDSMHGRVLLLVRGDRQTKDAFVPRAHYTIRHQLLPWRRY